MLKFIGGPVVGGGVLIAAVDGRSDTRRPTTTTSAQADKLSHTLVARRTPFHMAGSEWPAAPRPGVWVGEARLGRAFRMWLVGA